MGEQAGVTIFKQAKIQKWLLAGLLIRLAVMPFTTHSDLLSVYYRAHLLLDGRGINAFGPSFFNILHAGFLWLMKPLIPYSTIWGAPKQTTYLMIDWLGFVNQSAVFRSVFLFKLPYLAVEILVIWLLLKLTEPARAERVLKFWIFNPIVIFSTYIFGRFDMVTVFMLLSAVYLAKEKRPNLALIVLGLAAMLRIYPIILVLPFALVLESRGVGRARLTAVGFAPLLVTVFAGLAQGEAGPLKGLGAMQHLSYPLTMKFSLFAQDNFYVFIFLYSLMMMYLFINHEGGLESLKRNSLFVFLLFFATSFFHPHYLMWLVPFAAFYVVDSQFRAIYSLHVAAWVIYTFQWGRNLAGYLLAPLSPAFFWSAPGPSEWIDRYYPAVQFIGIGRSVFSATCLAMAYLVWRRQAEAVRPPVLVAQEPEEVAAR